MKTKLNIWTKLVRLMNSPFKFASLLLEKYCLEEVISPIFYKESQGEEYNCQEDGVLYYNRKYPRGYKDKDKYTKTWQECQERCPKQKIFKIQYLKLKKRCLEYKDCEGFTWHKDNHWNRKWSKSCSLFSTYRYKGKGNSVSGLRQCKKK